MDFISSLFYHNMVSNKIEMSGGHWWSGSRISFLLGERDVLLVYTVLEIGHDRGQPVFDQLIFLEVIGPESALDVLKSQHETTFSSAAGPII